jgi:hypothetical protein
MVEERAEEPQAVVRQRPSTRWWAFPWVASALLFVALLFVGPVSRMMDGFWVVSDEAVAALLPADLVRGQISVLFPGNPYQGIAELPVYAVLWQVFGANTTPMRIFHQAMWLSALFLWTIVALQMVERGGTRISHRAKGWAVLSVVGLLGVTAPIGWPVWFRIFPGYHLGALLAALAALVGLRSTTWRGWGVAGLLGGLAIYAQPMHLVGVVIVGVLALTSAKADRVRAIAATGAGVFLGVGPLLLWNARNSFEIFTGDLTPSENPEWGYFDRLSNTVSVTARVLLGDPGGRATAPDLLLVGQALAAAVLVALLAVGAVTLVRSWRTSAPLLAGIAVMLLGLPMLTTFSLDTDQRYAVSWWPALVILAATGAATIVSATATAVRQTAQVAIGLAIALQVACAASMAVTAIRDRSQYATADSGAIDLAADLQRCGVDAIAGDYFSVYPAVWGSDGNLEATVQQGPERLAGFVPDNWNEVETVAVLGPPNGGDAVALAAMVTEATGREADDWVALQHAGTATNILIEADHDLPAGCVGTDGLATSP